MIVAHVGTIGGGAGLASLKVHRGIRRAGVTSRFFAVDTAGASADDEIARFPRRVPAWNSGPSLAYRAAVKLYNVRRPQGAGLFSYTSLPVHSPFPFDIVRPDVLHLHWIAQGIDYRSFFDSIPPDLPVVWTLLDMEPFTGGCHYAGPCLGYQHGCGRCPQLNALRNPADLSAITFRRKRRRYARLNLTVVGIAEQSAREARRGPLFAPARAFEVIPIGIDTDRFAPRDRAASRAALGLSTDRMVVGFGAIDLGSIYKGFRVLVDALRRLPDPGRVQLLLFGGPLPRDVSLAPGSFHHVGFAKDAARLSTIYSAADVLVLPSLSEALGQVGLEALSCGTPVLGSRVGGIPDYVRDGETGFLFEAGSAADLAGRLAWMVEHPEERLRQGAAGPGVVRRGFSEAAVTRSYVELYERIAPGGRGSIAARGPGLAGAPASASQHASPLP